LSSGSLFFGRPDLPGQVRRPTIEAICPWKRSLRRVNPPLVACLRAVISVSGISLGEEALQGKRRICDGAVGYGRTRPHRESVPRFRSALPSRVGLWGRVAGLAFGRTRVDGQNLRSLPLVCTARYLRIFFVMLRANWKLAFLGARILRLPIPREFV
jgi:hypothetical protein